jgi:hypothetical protein
LGRRPQITQDYESVVTATAGQLYVRGPLTDGRGKAGTADGRTAGVAHQRLQQFITPSTWDDVAVRRNVAR